MRGLAAVVVMVMGCGPAVLPGAPQLGATCEMTAGWECYTDSSIAFCNGGKWDDYPCEARCSNAQASRCDPLNTEGTACPPAWEGTADCQSDTVQAICQGGKWVHRACGTCTQESWGSTCL